MQSAKLSASDVMTAPVVTVFENTPIEELASLMLQHGLSGLPVVDPDGALVGIVTEGDLLRRAELGTGRKRSRLYGLVAPASVARDYVRANGRTAGELMTRYVVTAGPGTPLCDVVDLMEQCGIKRIPVASHGRLCGIVSRADVIRAFLRCIRQRPAVELPDSEIRAQLVAEIGRQPWSTRNADVTVKDGIVHLHGVVYDHREHMAMRIAAANAPGAKGIRDELTCIEPLSGVPVETPEEIANLAPA